MRSVNSWNLTNKELHQLFKENNEFISIKVRGNTWEPITRWLKLDSRIFKETTSKARITLCDIESLAEIYNYRSIRWKAKKLTPLPTKVILALLVVSLKILESNLSHLVIGSQVLPRTLIEINSLLSLNN